MNKKILLAITLLFPFLSFNSFAQTENSSNENEKEYTQDSGYRTSISTNIVDWANLATINLSVNTAVSKHSTLGLTARYNPFVFGGKDCDRFNNKVRSLSLDYRYWTWHVHSGWWIMAKAQVSEYNIGNYLWEKKSEQGWAVGPGLGVGYTLMLSKHWNMDFGISGWLGYKDYKKYGCSYCGKPIENKSKFFVAPDNVLISVSYIF